MKIIDKYIKRFANNLDRSDEPRVGVLSINEEMRKGRVGGIPDDWGYLALNIPVDDMRLLQIRYPDLASLDSEIQHKAWLKFIASPESEIYKVRKRDGKKGLIHKGTIIK